MMRISPKIDEGLLFPADRSRLRDTMQNAPDRRISTAGRSPVLNKELQIDRIALRRDRKLRDWTFRAKSAVFKKSSVV